MVSITCEEFYKSVKTILLNVKPIVVIHLINMMPKAFVYILMDVLGIYWIMLDRIILLINALR